MPLYEYFCRDCNGIFELLRPVRQSADPQPCPDCDAESNRIMPTDFAAFVMRDGMPRRIPDQNRFWGVEGELKKPLTSQYAKHQDVIETKEVRRASANLTEEERAAPPSTEVKVRAKRKLAKKAE